MSEFVLELGVEEVPARFLPPALAQMEEKGAELLREARLGWDSLVALGTPRRLILRVTGLPSRQEAREVKVKGPARRVAFDEAGRPTRAALGFAAGQGVTADQLRVEEIAGGEYVFALRREEGRPTGEVLGGVAAELLARLEFPRSMRWGQGDYRFVRPVRWIVALLDEEVVPFEFAGVASGRVTWGHRSLHPGCREIRAAHEFLPALRELGVVADPGERKESIREQIRSAARELGGEVLADEELLEEVTFLVEHPTAVGGTFASHYLALPAAVPVTVLKHHQRCFSLVRPRSGAETGAQPGGGDRQVELLPGFVAVRDGGPQFLEVVREGY
ncbi:MAG TPA: glycine--tRNA ligase subunit beta, partial [Firmicutes bacterium]|nr:glycine--tRNA ligase subunit beta [Bacillota bacterium]